MQSANPNTPAIIDGQIEVVSANVVESITRGEIDIQIATAHKWPRSIDRFLKTGVTMATIDEETAATCLYRRPVGMEAGKQKFAEGMSVRMAEIVAACYGNIRVGAMIVEQTPRQVKVRGFAHDLESNYAVTTEVVELTVKKPRQGQTEGDPYDERMRIVIAKAALAKARRDAIFQVVPRALARPIEAQVRALLAGDTKSIERRRGVIVKWIEQLGIDAKRVWKAIDVNGPADLTVEHMETLQGIRTAIVDNEATVDESFPAIISQATVGAPKGAPTGKTVTEMAADEKAGKPDAGTQEEPKPEETKTEKPAAKTPKGPTADSLRAVLLKKGQEINAGKMRILEVAKEMNLADADIKWDDLDAKTLANIDDAWEQVKEAILHPA